MIKIIKSKLENKIGSNPLQLDLKIKVIKEFGRVLSILVLVSLSSTVFGIDGVAKLILEAREDSVKFVEINKLLTPNFKFSSQSIPQKVTNPKYFDFGKLEALDLISNREKYITITLPKVTSTGGNLVLDLISISEPSYDFRIKTSSGLEYNGRDLNLVHYRGVVRGYDTLSSVFLSISDDDVSLVIALEDKIEYEMYKDDKEKIHVLHSYQVLTYSQAEYLCGGEEQATARDPQVQNRETKKKGDDKCLYLFLEVEHEIYLEAGSSLEDLQKRVLKVFHKTAWLYEKIDVTLRLRELKLWDTPDPYTFNTVTGGNINANQSDFAAKKQDYIDHAIIPTDVNLAHVLTTYTSGGIQGTGGTFKCLDSGSDPRPSIERFSGACDNKDCRKIYVKTMAHEVAHSLSCGHTKDCRWNGNCTPMDNAGIFPASFVCDGVSVGPCGWAPHPNTADGGYWTVMSAQGEFSYNKHFGQQPGDLIYNFVNSQECLSSCDVSCDDLKDVIKVLAIQDVNSGDYDYRHSEISTTAYNEIDAGGEAEYYSTIDVFLKPDFRANNGSAFYAAIKPCENYPDIVIGNERNELVPDSNNYNNENASIHEMKELDFEVYPNPNTGELTIKLSSKSNYKVTVINMIGNTIYEEDNLSLKNIKLDITDHPKGIYLVQIINSEKSLTKKIIYN